MVGEERPPRSPRTQAHEAKIRKKDKQWIAASRALVKSSQQFLDRVKSPQPGWVGPSRSATVFKLSNDGAIDDTHDAREQSRRLKLKNLSFYAKVRINGQDVARVDQQQGVFESDLMVVPQLHLSLACLVLTSEVVAGGQA